MSEDAQTQVSDWQAAFDTFQEVTREQVIRENQMVARALAMQQSGIIPMHTDPEWVDLTVREIPLESLR